MTVLTAPAGPGTADAVVVPLCDDDATVAGEFVLRDRLDAALSSAPAVVVVDLAPCHYLDAPGLRVLLEAHARAARQGTALRLRHCTPEVVRLLDAAGAPADLREP